MTPRTLTDAEYRLLKKKLHQAHDKLLKLTLQDEDAMRELTEKMDLRDQLITYLLGQSDLSGQDLEELISNIFSPVLKQEIMISGTGFLAVAAREAAASATAEAEKKAERVAKRNKAAIAAAKKETKIAQEEAERTKQEAERTKQEAERTKQEALQLKTRLIVMKSWNKGSSADFISDIVDLSHDEVSQLIAVFENLKTHSYSKTDVGINELVEVSGLTEFEVKTFLMLLK